MSQLTDWLTVIEHNYFILWHRKSAGTSWGVYDQFASYIITDWNTCNAWMEHKGS